MLPELRVIAVKTAEFQGTPQNNTECLGIKRFFQVVECALFDCSHGALDAPLSREDDKGERGVAFPGRMNQLNAIHFRHDKIGDHQIHCLIFQQGKGFLAIGGADDRIALLQQVVF